MITPVKSTKHLDLFLNTNKFFDSMYLIEYLNFRFLYHKRVSLEWQERPTFPNHVSLLRFVMGSVLIVQCLVFCIVFCISLFVLLSLAIELYVLRVVVSDYPFGVFKHFFLTIYSKSFSPSCREDFRYQWWTPDKCKLLWKYMTRDYQVLSNMKRKFKQSW